MVLSCWVKLRTACRSCNFFWRSLPADRRSCRACDWKCPRFLSFNLQPRVSQSLYGVLICSAPITQYHRLGSLQQPELICSQFWRLSPRSRCPCFSFQGGPSPWFAEGCLLHVGLPAGGCRLCSPFLQSCHGAQPPTASSKPNHPPPFFQTLSLWDRASTYEEGAQFHP